MSDRGEYRACFVAMRDDVDIHAMSPAAFKLLWMLKLSLPATGIGVVYPSTLAEQVGVDRDELDSLFAELEQPKPGKDRGWIKRERNVVWIVRALEFEPALTPTNVKKHVPFVHRLVAQLPRDLAIVDEFREYYFEWFGSMVEPASNTEKEPSPKGIDSLSIQKKKKENSLEREKTSSAAATAREDRQQVLGGEIGEELPTQAGRDALESLLRAAPHAHSWVAEMRAMLGSMAGHEPATPASLERALIDYAANGETPRLSRFRGYVRNASRMSASASVPPSTSPAARRTAVLGRSDGAPSAGEAAVLLGKIRALRRENQQPGQSATQFIPKAKVQALGVDVLQAYEAIGGAERVLSTSGEKWSFLIRDFTQALEAVRGGAEAAVSAGVPAAGEAPAHA